MSDVVALVGEDRTALFRVVPELLGLAPELLHHQVDEDDGADDQQRHEKAVVVDESQLQVERARNGEEEVQVDEHADRRVEDLLDECRAEHPGEGRAADQGDVHQQRHDGADVGRQEPVHRYSCGIRGQDVAVAHASVRVPGDEDEIPGDGRQHSLNRLEAQSDDDVADRDPGHRVPQPLEPVEDVEAAEVAEDEHHCDADDPERDLQQAAVPRAVVERRDRLDRVVEHAHEARLSRREDGREDTRVQLVRKWCRGRRAPWRATASTGSPPSGRRRCRLGSRSSAPSARTAR